MPSQVQILDEAVCTLYSANNLGKSINPIILPSIMDSGLFNFSMATSLEGKLRIQTCENPHKNQPCVATYVCKGVWYIYIYIYSQQYIDKCKVKLVTLVEGNLKAPFSIATTPRCRETCNFISFIAPLYP